MRRPLGAEPLLATADLARLFAEIRGPTTTGTTGATGAAGAAGAAAQQPLPAHALATVPLSSWGDDAFDELKARSADKVLVVDVGREPLARLPSAEWLVAHGGAGAAAEEAIGAHAARCFVALGKSTW